MAQLRHSLSGERSRRFVGDQVTDRKGVESTNGAPPLMTVEEFHHECLRIVAKLKASSRSIAWIKFHEFAPRVRPSGSGVLHSHLHELRIGRKPMLRGLWVSFVFLGACAAEIDLLRKR